MNNNKVQAIVEKVKELVQRGNVSRIVVRKGERVLLNIPVNVGIVGGVVAFQFKKFRTHIAHLGKKCAEKANDLTVKPIHKSIHNGIGYKIPNKH